ncbi:hypothetical protein K3179_10575 [Qipengyuania sp. GH38]|uniref:hypothetical protein n=1 Tax=Qipengyuania intermedia TaxID=2867244 RepID=UPI001C87A3F9|nr:hypothetical protein [Qipengyuania intermedia]MBX7514985.1 hypothetical protein [Qipengyuania intermedia]
MSNDTLRVIASKDGYEANALGNALGYVKAIAEAKKIADPDVILLTHTKQQLEHTSIASALGKGAAKALASNQRIDLPFGGTLRNETLRTISPYIANKIIIVGYGEDKILDFVDGITAPAGIVVIPDLPGSADKWKERWNPTVHGEKRGEAATLIDDKVTVSALTTLSKVINLSTGLSHPRDKEMANEILRILRTKGHAIEHEKFKSWAIRNGWKPDGAQQLAEVAEKIAKLKNNPSLAKIHDPHGRYARWKEKS